MGFLFLKLPPPPCALLLVHHYIPVLSYNTLERGGERERESNQGESSRVCPPQSWRLAALAVFSVYAFNQRHGGLQTVTNQDGTYIWSTFQLTFSWGLCVCVTVVPDARISELFLVCSCVCISELCLELLKSGWFLHPFRFFLDIRLPCLP